MNVRHLQPWEIAMLTPEGLRELANAPRTPFWEGQARQMLQWAADALEAANAAIYERKPSQTELKHE